MKDIKNNLKRYYAWRIQLTIAINFTSSKDIDEEYVMHWPSDNIDIMIYDKADKVIEELSEQLFNIYQIGLETSIKVVILSLISLIHCITNVIKSELW